MANKIIETEKNIEKSPEELEITFEIDVAATKQYKFTKQRLIERKKKLQSQKITINQMLMKNNQELEDVNSMLLLVEKNGS